MEIGTHVNAWNLDEPALFEFFAAAEELNAAVFVHPWDMIGRERMPKYWLPWLVGMPAETSLAACSLIFGGVLERLPSLRIALAHGGGAFPATWGRIQHAFHVRPDLCAWIIRTRPANTCRGCSSIHSCTTPRCSDCSCTGSDRDNCCWDPTIHFHWVSISREP